MTILEDSSSDNCFNFFAYSVPASISCIEHGPAIIRKRSSDPFKILFNVLRPSLTRDTVSSVIEIC